MFSYLEVLEEEVPSSNDSNGPRPLYNPPDFSGPPQRHTFPQLPPYGSCEAAYLQGHMPRRPCTTPEDSSESVQLSDAQAYGSAFLHDDFLPDIGYGATYTGAIPSTITCMKTCASPISRLRACAPCMRCSTSHLKHMQCACASS